MDLFEGKEDSNQEFVPLNSGSIGTYSQIRLLNKSGICSSLLILLRATTGLGVLTNQFYFILNGFVLSPVIIITLLFFVGLCISLLLSVCNHIEAKNQDIIERYEDIIEHLPMPAGLKCGIYIFTKVG